MTQRFKILILFISCIFSARQIFAEDAQTIDDSDAGQIHLSDVMRAASNKFPSVEAQRLRIRATKSQIWGVGFDSLTMGANLTKVSSLSSFRAGELRKFSHDDLTSKQASVQIVGSFQTLFAMRGLGIAVEDQKEVLRTLQMDLAAKAAAAYIGFSASNYKLIYLRKIWKKLIAIDPKQIQDLNALQASILGGDIALTKSQILTAEKEQKDNGATLLKFLGPEKFKALCVKVGARAASQEHLDEPLNLDALYKIFPVPETEGEIFAKIDNSPFIRRSKLAIKAARNNELLRVAGYLPAVVLGATKNLSRTTSHTTLEDNFTVRGSTFFMSLNWSIGGGAAFNLNADNLFVEANKLSHIAAKDDLKESVRQSIDSLVDLHEQFPIQLAGLKASYLAFKEINVRTGAEVALLDLTITNIKGLVAGITSDINTLIETRIAVLVAMGTLLDEIDGLAKVEQLYGKRLP